MITWADHKQERERVQEREGREGEMINTKVERISRTMLRKNEGREDGEIL